MANLLDRVKKAGKNVVDAGAKTMLKLALMELGRDVAQNDMDDGVFACLSTLRLAYLPTSTSLMPLEALSRLFDSCTDIIFLDREIKTRKQAFGVEVYDLMAELETAENMSAEDKEAKIRSAFDSARKDIAVIEAKKECKKEEMSVLATENPGAATNNIPPSSGTVLTNTHPQDSEMDNM
eukprot:scaffold1184_cov132-Cylindrotheca_fusiformis.AAC.78